LCGWGPVDDAGASSTTCDVPCPVGWSKSPAAPDLCINGAESFSQATGPDSTVQNPDAAATATTSDGMDCALSGQQGGPSYSVQCSNVTQTCTCTINGKTTTIAGVVVCQVNDDAALVNLAVQGCGFPLL
jgi:hypothetical protein